MVLRITVLHNTYHSTGTQWTCPKEPRMGYAITVMGTLRSVRTNNNHTLHSLIPFHLAGLWASVSWTSIKEGAESFQQNTTREGTTCCMGPREIKVSPQDSACQMDFLQALSMGLSSKTGRFFWMRMNSFIDLDVSLQIGKKEAFVGFFFFHQLITFHDKRAIL